MPRQLGRRMRVAEQSACCTLHAAGFTCMPAPLCIRRIAVSPRTVYGWREAAATETRRLDTTLVQAAVCAAP